MRPAVLVGGYRPTTKMLFALVRVFSGRPLPDAAKLTFYRPDFYGKFAKTFTHEAMRGPSVWSVGDRELMAAYVSKINDCPFCVGAHTATAAGAYQDHERVTLALADVDTAPIEAPLRETLRMLGTLTRDGRVSATVMRSVLDAGASPEQVLDALAVAFAFNTTNRLANAFDFEIPDSKAFEEGAHYLLKRGYR
jgi:AhpD family alkylhydroperoxidase